MDKNSDFLWEICIHKTKKFEWKNITDESFECLDYIKKYNISINTIEKYNVRNHDSKWYKYPCWNRITGKP